MTDEIVRKATQHLDSLVALSSEVKVLIDKSVKELNDRQFDVQTSATSLTEIQKQVEIARVDFNKRESILRKSIDEFLKEKNRLETEVAGLVGKKGELKIENFRLSAKNVEFRAYEDKAWKALKAKETSLLEREKNLEQRENLRPNNKSLLPPME